jgi:mannose-6-phosphate isomerase-like protein (cupin superfamily)
MPTIASTPEITENTTATPTPSAHVHPGKLFKADGHGVVYRQRLLHNEAALEFLNVGEYLLPSATGTAVSSLPNRECLLFMSKGEVTAEVNGQPYDLAKLDTLYVPKGAAYRLRNESMEEPATVTQISAPAATAHPVVHSRFLEFSEREERMRRLHQKVEYLMFDVGDKADKLVAGYTFHEPFTRAWPPRCHSDQEAVYVFIQGHGSVEVCETPEKLVFVKEVKEGDLVTIPPANHHAAFSQEDPLAFIWCIAGERA